MGKYKTMHHSDQPVREIDHWIKESGFHIWSVDSTDIPTDIESAQDVVWHPLGRYQMTAELIREVPGFRLATPYEFILGLKTIYPLNMPHICLYKVKGAGQAGTGYGLLIASGGRVKNQERSMVSVEIGDGHGEHCVLARVSV